MTRSLLSLVSLLVLVVAIGADDAKPPTTATGKQLAEILDRYDDRELELLKQLDQAVKADVPRLRDMLKKLKNDTARQLMDIIDKNPKDANILPAAEFLIFQETEQAEKALAVVAEHHADGPKMGQFCDDLLTIQLTSTGAEKVMRAVFARNSRDINRARAGLALVTLLKINGDADGLADKDREKLQTEAEKLAEELTTKFPRLKLDDDPDSKETVHAAASKLLYEVRNLSIGKEAPELDGPDVDGKRLRLRDYRGKVILLDFWGFWCGVCVGMLPHERELVKRLDGKPFALIGVNSDENLEEYRKLAKKESVTWRSFQDKLGGDKQAISEMWNVQGWPTLYLIDHKGVIRRKWIGAPDEKALDKAIDELLRAAEKDSPK